MAYIGNTAEQQAFTPAIDYFNGNGSTVAFTLSRPVASVAQVQAVIENVPQNPGDAFTVSGNTITFTSAPPSGTSNIYVYYTSPITQVIQPGQGTVGTAQIQNGVTVNFADGSASAPSITNDGDTNTGLFFPAADTIGFAEGGAEIARFDSSGNFAIGTSSVGMGLQVVKNWTSGAATVGAQSVTAFSSGGEAGYGTFDSNGTRHAYFSSADTATRIWVNATKPLVFGTDAVERGRFDTSGNFLFNSGYGSVATAYGCRAWVNFNGTGTVSIRGSGNVSSITDNGTGNYQVNFNVVMPDANISPVATCHHQSGITADGVVNFAAMPTSSNASFYTVIGGTSFDSVAVCVAVFR
jgi:hypothetical protein